MAPINAGSKVGESQTPRPIMLLLVGAGGLSELGKPGLSLPYSSPLPLLPPPSPKRQKAISPGVTEGIQVKGGWWQPFPSSQLLPLTPSLLGLCASFSPSWPANSPSHSTLLFLRNSPSLLFLKSFFPLVTSSCVNSTVAPFATLQTQRVGGAARSSCGGGGWQAGTLPGGGGAEQEAVWPVVRAPNSSTSNPHRSTETGGK